jgi:FMN phosphatase YigB (HAD superfamily)
MKYIFDFDDTLFDTKKFKELIFDTLMKSGVERDVAISKYNDERRTGKPFSLRNFLLKFDRADKYELIMSHCPFLLNTNLIDTVRRLGRENCYIVTHGDTEFQKDKIEKSGIKSFFADIKMTPVGKKEQIQEICKLNEKDEVVFIDDKPKFANEKGLNLIPNLTTIVYTPAKLAGIIKRVDDELKRAKGGLPRN